MKFEYLYLFVALPKDAGDLKKIKVTAETKAFWDTEGCELHAHIRSARETPRTLEDSILFL